MTMKKSLSALVLAATAITGVAATPAEARSYRNDGYYGDYGRAGYGNSDYRRDNRDYRRDRNRYNDRYQYRCKNDGTTGTIIGAIAGGLLGHEVAGRGSRTEGAIIGAAVGALGGRAIDKSDSNCRR